MKANIENKLRDFMLNRVLPLMTDELEEGYPLKSELISREFVCNEPNYGAFLDQGFGTSQRKLGKHKCIDKIIEDKGLTLLQLLIFIVKHNLDFCDNAGHYCEEGCYLYLNKKTSISMSSSTHSMLLGGKLETAIKSGFDCLKGKYCGKNYSSPVDDFNYEYWKIQAELFFKELPPLSNKRCSDKKAGITWDKECKDCDFFKKDEDDYQWKHGASCDFDYNKEYRSEYNRTAKVGFVLLLPDDGSTYACKHFSEIVK